MKIEYDQKADALYMAVQQRKFVERSREVEPGVVVDLDNKGRVIGFEVLSVSKRYKPSEFKQVTLENIAVAV